VYILKIKVAELLEVDFEFIDLEFQGCKLEDEK
jgi:hypothetical protein